MAEEMGEEKIGAWRGEKEGEERIKDGNKRRKSRKERNKGRKPRE